jgi:hypothetical protein
VGEQRRTITSANETLKGKILKMLKKERDLTMSNFPTTTPMALS